LHYYENSQSFCYSTSVSISYISELSKFKIQNHWHFLCITIKIPVTYFDVNIIVDYFFKLSMTSKTNSSS
jgi:hypothetical protein